jgi:SAM-dependent methyltransferase
LENVTFRQADAQIHPFAAASFDLAMSRAGTMFFGDPTAAFTNIGRALCPGGRLTLLVWKGPERNRWVGQFSSALAAGRDVPGPPVGVPGPFGQADPGRVRCVLTSAGFTNVDYIGLEEPLCFGTDVEDADRFVLGLMGWMLRGLDDSARRAAMDRLTATLAAHDRGHGVLFESAAWLVEATR